MTDSPPPSFHQAPAVCWLIIIPSVFIFALWQFTNHLKFKLQPSDLAINLFLATMASPSKMPRIVELAAQISSSVTELQARLTAQGAPSPSWAEDSPESLPADVASLQDAVLDASAELHELLLEPLMLVLRFAAVLLPSIQWNLFII